eukprot:9785123-Ditylum_brightwellii.AAC.1
MNVSEDESEYHFQHSGYDALRIAWQTGNEEGNESFLCAWEAIPMEYSSQFPSYPTLSEGEKDAIISSLDELEEEDEFKSWFSLPVNTSQYSDYPNMIEVPMSLSFIRRRIEEGYYSNKLSVAADMKLIMVNSAKYNGASEITDSARDMYSRFMESCEQI